ncbi:hypothetical protein [Pseudonocardia acidicola]|uniref:PE family protein n=1 Tax=Pseudonocardia acidicola TaxID=2724939 RepID=A0ABX1SFT1_9PSEU|nr:hypothetical protein [Pseudonocardia acidicola]NMI00406.1 hypothetical protein [Pseudonocardia acidicola]
MTQDVPPPDPQALDRAARWVEVLAQRLSEVVPEVGRLVGQVARDWPDHRGREWTERASLVHRELLRELDAATELARSTARLAAESSTMQVPAGAEQDVGRSVPSWTIPRPVGRASGPRLGGTDAERVEDERGVRIPLLPDPPEPSG